MATAVIDRWMCRLAQVATSDLGRRGADLFSRVAAALTSGDAASLSAAQWYRKAFHLLPDDGSTRTALEAALNAVEERNRRTVSAPAVVRAAIRAETYKPRRARLIHWVIGS